MSNAAINWALKQKTGRATARLVLFALANRADVNGVCWPKVEVLADDTELKARSIRYQLKKLRSLGLIRIKRVTDGGQSSNCYYLCLPWMDEQTQIDRAAQYAVSRSGRATAPANRDRAALHSVQPLYTKPTEEPSTPPAGAGDADRISDAVRNQLRSIIGGDAFNAYLIDAEYSETPVPRLTVNTSFKRAQVEAKYGHKLRELFGERLVICDRRETLNSTVSAQSRNR